MDLKRVLGAAVAALLMTGAGASAYQPEVKVTDLRLPVVFDTSNALTLLMVDPWDGTNMRVQLVDGFATLDVDADPFVAQ